MDPFAARPRVADLVFRLYDRPVHPELFDALLIREIRRNDYTLILRLTPTGHVLEWHTAAAHLVEVTAAAGEALPTGARLSRRFEGGPRGKLRWPGGRYETSLFAETLPADVYLHAHDELAADGVKRGMFGHFRPRHRFGLAPLGFVAVDPVPGGLVVSAFHTFPDELAVVKTQSLIETTPRE